MTSSSSQSKNRHLRDFLRRYPDIKAIDIVLNDCNGIGRGKIIRRHELEGLFTSGRHMPSSILGLDICGEDVDETGLVWEQGDGDLRAWPIANTLRPLLTTNPPRAEVMLTLHELDGTPQSSDPRHALSRQVDALAAEGLSAAGAFELEFFLLANELGPDGKPRAAHNLVDGSESDKTEVYSVDRLQGMLPLFDQVYDEAAAAGIEAETVISEYAPGQYELTLNYRKDVVQAADDLVRLKRIVRRLAKEHGIVACFMAKPMEDYAGSGMHFHVSLLNEAGENAFAEEEGAGFTDRLLHAIGGLRETMAESMLIFAPHMNSWRRFANQSYAPVSTNWGVNNRSVALRVPAGDRKARRIEHRPAGVDANPYLIAATVIAGMRHGMANKIDPGAETKGDGYSQLEGTEDFPRDWRAAIEKAKASEFLKDALGPDMHRTFVAVKEAEYLRVASTITALDYDMYMRTV
ncbi:glutamine synthetase family protein [Ruegeria halocynthiae]|uniref:glutamine synthetase family protein n=1 Tax=Ruegeria halocynthiae TaxID=985054 RepID=UPI00056D816A|nr:glutamine synthetase family protein [Ruegeria halocynthiae]